MHIHSAHALAASIVAAPTPAPAPANGPDFGPINSWLIHNPLVVVVTIVAIVMVYLAIRGKIGKILAILACAVVGLTFIGVGVDGWIALGRSFASLLSL